MKILEVGTNLNLGTKAVHISLSPSGGRANPLNGGEFHQRVENERGKYDFVITRAVAQIDQLWQWSAPLIAPKHINALPNGLIALKSGNIDAECKSLPKKGFYDKEHISQYFKESYFEEKYVVYVN